MKPCGCWTTRQTYNAVSIVHRCATHAREYRALLFAAHEREARRKLGLRGMRLTLMGPEAGCYSERN